jgi:hypothetical protein
MSFRQLSVCYFVAPSLTRGQVCNLLVQLLLGLARAVTLGSKSRRTHGHILLSHLRLLNLEGKVPYLYPPGVRGSSCGRQTVDQFVLVSGLPLGPITRFYLSLIFSSDNYCILLSMASSLTRKRVCSLECNHSLVRSLTTSNHTLPSHPRLFSFCSLLRLAGTTVEVF